MSDSTTHDKMNCTTCLKSDSELGVSTSPSNIPARKRNKYNIFDCDDNEQDDSKALNMSQLKQWQHFGGDELQNLDSVSQLHLPFLFFTKRSCSTGTVPGLSQVIRRCQNRFFRLQEHV